jgi:hypothetical protein
MEKKQTMNRFFDHFCAKISAKIYTAKKLGGLGNFTRKGLEKKLPEGFFLPKLEKCTPMFLPTIFQKN